MVQALRVNGVSFLFPRAHGHFREHERRLELEHDVLQVRLLVDAGGLLPRYAAANLPKVGDGTAQSTRSNENSQLGSEKNKNKSKTRERTWSRQS